MRHEVYNWVAALVERFQPQAPVLEVGSYDVNGTIRDLFPQEGYLGLDKREGPGVDLVSDVVLEHRGELARQFNTAICVETLEHVTDPRQALFRMHSYLAPGGLLILTWCFVYPIHEQEDYWRVTPDGLRMLLEKAIFTEIEIETEAEGPRGVFATARRPG